MKKVLSAILAITMMLSMSTVFARGMDGISIKPINEGAVHNVFSTKGEIEEISEGRIKIVGEGIFKEIVLTIPSSTYILNAQDGTKILFKDLKKGDVVTAYYGPRLTKSIPPQGNAIALMVGAPEKGSAGMYMKVSQLDKNEDGSVKVLCTNADRLVTIAPDLLAKNTDIQVGSELIVWYDIMTMSMPAQANATKVMVLPVKADIRVHTLAGVIVVNGQELPLTEHDIIKNNANTIMLPLRVIAENLGYNVVWHDGNKAVELLQNGTQSIMLTIGSKDYDKSNNRAVQLDYAPEMANGKTLVPVEFFTDILGLKVEINNSHI